MIDLIAPDEYRDAVSGTIKEPQLKEIFLNIRDDLVLDTKYQPEDATRWESITIKNIKFFYSYFTDPYVGVIDKANLDCEMLSVREILKLYRDLFRNKN